MRTKTLLAMFGMIATTFVLFIKMMTPSSVQFIIEGNVVELNKSRASTAHSMYS